MVCRASPRGTLFAFNQSLDNVTLPGGLQSLDVRCGFNQSLGSERCVTVSGFNSTFGGMLLIDCFSFDLLRICAALLRGPL